MRVALAFPGCHRRGGVERVVFECARFLAGRGHGVHVYASDFGAELPPVISRHHVFVQPRPSFLCGLSFFHHCTDLIRDINVEVVNTHGCVCPTGGVHWVQSLHRAWLERSKQFRSPFSVARLKQRLNPLHPILLRLEAEHFARRNYRKVIATTEQVRQDLGHYYGVPSDDVTVIPNGFAPTEFNPARRSSLRAAARARLGLSPTNVALLFVANELERKGYTTLMDALARLRRPEVRLLVVGRPDPRVVMARANEFGVAAQVVACGSTTDVGQYHAAADMFVLPTQYEAFCLAILEALGSGLPVVTSRVPGARDAIAEGVNGELIDDPNSGSELAEALQPFFDDGFRQRLSDAAPSTVSQYQWPVVLEQYERVLLGNCRSANAPTAAATGPVS